MTPRVLISVVCILLLGHPQSATAAEGQTIHGVVTNTDDARLPNAKVVLRSDETNEPEYGTLTSIDGTFVIRDIANGRYRLVVEKDGYVPYLYGQRSPSAPPGILVITRELTEKNVSVRLTRAASISGRITDENGSAVVGAQITVYRRRMRNEQPIFSAMPSVQTNDLGEYRAYGLSPGKYYVGVAYTRNIVAAYKVLRVDESNRSEQYVPTFFPGVLDPLEATPIEVGPGNDARGVDFSVNRGTVVKIRGRLTGCDFQSPDSVSISLSRRVIGISQWLYQRTGKVLDKDGNFEVTAIPTGGYQLSVIVRPPNRSWTVMPLDVGAHDMDDLVIACDQRVQVQGRVRTEGNVKLGELVSVSLRPDAGPPVGLSSGATGYGSSLKRDGTFIIADIAPGKYRLRIQPLPQTVFVKSMKLGTRDVLDEGIVLDGAASDTLEIVLSDRAATVDGFVFDDDRKPVSNVWVILVPEARLRHRDDLFVTAQTDDNGHFQFRRIPPGDYELYSWETVDLDSYREPNFLAKYKPRAKPLHLDPGTNATINLELIPLQ